MKKQFIALATIFTLSAGAFVTTDASAAEHKIKKGETLEEISMHYSMTVDELKKLNNLTSDKIIADKTLQVLDGNDFYTIVQGDTLGKIGDANNASVADLKKWNDLSSDLIIIGETLAVTKEAGELRNKKSAKQQPIKQKAKVETKQQAAKQPSKSAPKQEAKASASTSKTLTMTATAYTAYCEGCSGITANGTNLRSNPNAKVIAVDPSIIPLGSKVWVEGYGEAIAADTGGAIKGKKIDVFIPTKENANNWGRKTVQVKILN